MTDHNSIYAALSAAQGEFPPIPKSRTVTVKTRTGGNYEFAYAPLDTILQCVRPALAKHGLALVQSVERSDGSEFIVTRITHSSGEFIQSSVEIMGHGTTPQEYGSALTYARRYGVTMALCLASEDDEDGNLASGNEVAHRVDRQRAAAPAVPVSQDTLAKLAALIETDGERLKAGLAYHKVSRMGELSEEQAQHILRSIMNAKAKQESGDDSQ